MNTYQCFCNGKKVEVKADTTYAAQQEAAKLLKVRKAYQVSVILVEKDGEPVTHSTALL